MKHLSQKLFNGKTIKVYGRLVKRSQVLEIKSILVKAGYDNLAGKLEASLYNTTMKKAYDVKGSLLLKAFVHALLLNNERELIKVTKPKSIQSTLYRGLEDIPFKNLTEKIKKGKTVKFDWTYWTKYKETAKSFGKVISLKYKGKAIDFGSLYKKLKPELKNIDKKLRDEVEMWIEGEKGTYLLPPIKLNKNSLKGIK